MTPETRFAARSKEQVFREAAGHSTICHCVRRVRGKLVVTRYSCNCGGKEANYEAHFGKLPKPEYEI